LGLSFCLKVLIKRIALAMRYSKREGMQGTMNRQDQKGARRNSDTRSFSLTQQNTTESRQRKLAQSGNEVLLARFPFEMEFFFF